MPQSRFLTNEKKLTPRHLGILHYQHHTSCQHTRYSPQRPKNVKEKFKST